MTRLNDKYEKFIQDIEKNIKDKQDLVYIKEKLTDFMQVVIEEMNSIVDLKENKMQQLEQKQKDIDIKLEKMQQILDNIEKDIYSEDGFDFEIVCPYCNYEFVIDMGEEKTEIECPECQNIIELDWSGDIEGDISCNGGCSACNGCDTTTNTNDTKKDEIIQKKEENDDDM